MRIVVLFTMLAGVAGACDATLWKNVYHSDRLPDKADCRTVGGTIRNFKAEADGDYHVRFVADDASLINAKNTSEQGGALVVEPICQNKPTQRDAMTPCKSYKGPKFDMKKFCPGAPSRLAIGKSATCKNPPHLEISGFYTVDSEHGWMELHSVSEIKIK